MAPEGELQPHCPRISVASENFFVLFLFSIQHIYRASVVISYGNWAVNRQPGFRLEDSYRKEFKRHFEIVMDLHDFKHVVDQHRNGLLVVSLK